MSTTVDGSEKDFFRFIEEYEGLISKHVPGTYGFEYTSKVYMLPVYEHLEKVVANTPKGGRILELGCGRGHFSAYLALRGFQVEGYEVTEPKLADDCLYSQDKGVINHYPKLWAQAKADYGVDCHYYDGENFPAADGTFDSVLFYASFEHVPEIRKVAGESFRSLKSGGRAFVFRCPSILAPAEHLAERLGLGAHAKRYRKAELLGIIKDTGYTVEYAGRTDFFPAFVGPFQKLENFLAPALIKLEHLLRFTPLAFFFHHFEVRARKP